MRLTQHLVVVLILAAIVSIVWIDYRNQGGRFALTAAGAEVLLYFADDDASYLVPELRRFPDEAGATPELILRALIEGPTDDSLSPTLPPTTQVLGIEREGDVLIVNFDSAIRDAPIRGDRYVRGSAGELMAVYSIVHSLTELPGIERVWIQIEGEVVETLVGHMYLREPLDRNEALIAR